MVVETILGAALAAGAIGLILVVSSLVSRVRFETPGVEAVTVLLCTGEADGLEGRLRDASSRRGRVYILDAGMSGEAACRARLLALRFGAAFTDGKDLTEELRSTHGRH